MIDRTTPCHVAGHLGSLSSLDRCLIKYAAEECKTIPLVLYITVKEIFSDTKTISSYISWLCSAVPITLTAQRIRRREPLATLSIPCLSKQRSIAVLPTEDHCEMSAYHHPYTLKLAHSTSLSPLLSSTAGSIQRSCFPGGGIFRRLVFPFLFRAAGLTNPPPLTLIMSFSGSYSMCLPSPRKSSVFSWTYWLSLWVR